MKTSTLMLACMVGCASVCLGQKYEGSEDFEGTTVTGRIVWPGEAPGPLLLEANKNPAVCCGEGEAACDKDSGRLTVHPENNGVKNCVVFLASYPLDTPGKAFEKGAEIDQLGCAYDPHVVFVQIGKKLVIRNSDDILHNVHGYLGNDTAFNLAMPLPATSKQKLKKPGRIELRCDAGHTWMTAWVWVVEHPYYAVTDENGVFSLSGVPDGAYELVVWHEGWEVVDTLESADGTITGYVFSEPLEMEPVEIVVDAGEVFELPAEIVLE